MLSMHQMKKILEPYNQTVPEDDFRIIDSWVENEKDGSKSNLKYFCYELEAVNPATGKKTKAYKAVKFARVERLPKSAKTSTSLMDMQSQVLTAAYREQYNLVTIIANVIHPTPEGLMFLYGVQGVSGKTIEEAKRIADLDFKGFIGAMMGTFRVLQLRTLTSEEAAWLREKMRGMKFMTAVRGIPKASETGDDGGNKGIGASNVNPNSEGTLEEIITALADYEYVIEVLSAPVRKEVIESWTTQTEKDMTDWYGQLQGTKSLSMSISLPMTYMTSTGNSQGWSRNFTNSRTVSYTQGESYNTGYSQNVGKSLSQSLGQSFGVSQGNSTTQSSGTSHSISQGLTRGQTVGVTEGITRGQTYGQTVGHTQGLTKGYTQGISKGSSSGISVSQTMGNSLGSSTGTSKGVSLGKSLGESVNQSYSSGVSRSNSSSKGTSTNLGSSYGQSIGQNVSKNYGDSSSLNHSVGTSKNANYGLSGSSSISGSHSDGTSASSGASGSTSRSNSVTHSTSEGTSGSQSSGWNQSESNGTSKSTSQGTSHTVSNGTSKSSSTGYSHGTSSGGSSSYGTSSSTGTSTGITGGGKVGIGGVGFDLSTNKGDSTNNGTSQNYSFNSGTNSGYNNTKTHGSSNTISDGTTKSNSIGSTHSISSGTSESVSNGWSQGSSSGTSESAGASNGWNNSSGTSHSDGSGWSLGSGTSQSQGAGSSESYSTGQGASYSEGYGASYGQNTGLSYSNGSSASQGTSVGSSQSAGASVGSTNGSSYGTSAGTSASSNVGQSYSVAISQNKSSSTTSSMSQSVSQSESLSQSISQSDSLSRSYSQSNSQSLSQSQSESAGTSESTSIGSTSGKSYTQSLSNGTGQSWSEGTSTSSGQSYGTSNGESTGQSYGNTGSYTTGTSGSMGVGPSVGYTKSYQWLDQQVKDILEILEYQNERLKKATRQGAFYTYVYIACPDMDALAVAQAAAISTWQNSLALRQPIQALDLTDDEQQHLLYHFTAFSSDVSRENVHGVSDYKYATVLLPDEFVAYTHLPRISEGGIDTIVEDVPKFRVPGLMRGGIYMGTQLNAERYTFKNGYRTQFDYRINIDELMHGIFTGQSRSGKTVAAMRFIRELANSRRTATGKRLRIVIMDPKQDWRGIARFVEPERFRFYSLGNTSFRPINLNPCKIPYGVTPQHWIDGIINIYCRAYGLLERGKQMLSDVFYKLYKQAGVFDEKDKDDPSTWHPQKPDWDWNAEVSWRSGKVTFHKIYKDMDAVKTSLQSSNTRVGNDTMDAYSRLLERLSCFSRPFAIEYRLFSAEKAQTPGKSDFDDPNSIGTGLGVDELIGADDVTVFESFGLESTFANFIFGIITSGFYKVAKGFERGYLNKSQYETVLVIEEANKVLTGNDAAGSGGGGGMVSLSGQSEFEEILDQSAGYGLFIIAITQKPSMMPSSIIANCGMLFMGKLSQPEDVDLGVRMIGREGRIDDRDVVKFLPKCPTGWFIIRSNRGYDFRDAEPVLVQIAPLNNATVSNAELDEILIKRDVKLALQEDMEKKATA